MKVIILAAGSGFRMKPLTADIPKALLKLGNETLLTRLRRQMHSNSVDEVIVVAGFEAAKISQDIERNPIDGLTTKVVINENYANDTNIVSLQKARAVTQGGYYIFEADIIFENDCIAYILSREWADKSVWFTGGPFVPGLYGGVLKENHGVVEDINIIPGFTDDYIDYKKLIGVMKVGSTEAGRFSDYIDDNIQQQRDCYYLNAWYENQQHLPSVHGDLSKYVAKSFNKAHEYREAIDYFHEHSAEFVTTVDNTQISLVDVSELREIEGHSPERALWLKDKIAAQGQWLEPLKIEKEHKLVLDGHHRLQVALQLGLSKVPCLEYAYDDVDIWSLRDNEYVTRGEVIKRALEGDIYPYKTVKHKFDRVVNCNYSLDELTEVVGI